LLIASRNSARNSNIVAIEVQDEFLLTAFYESEKLKITHFKINRTLNNDLIDISV